MPDPVLGLEDARRVLVPDGQALLLDHVLSRKPQLGGALVLDRHDPRFIRYRSPAPILVPETQEETTGTVANVVFPTGIDRRLDLGRPDWIDVYYGMADSRIGVARLTVPDTLPPDALADPHEGRV